MSLSSYIATSSKLSLFNKNAVIVNNIANYSTTGYKRDVVAFRDLLSSQNGKQSLHFHDIRTFIDHSVASLKKTDNDLDFAILQPNHFFSLNTPRGIRYTRSGNFLINKSGILVSADGSPVLSDSASNIVFSSGSNTEKIRVDEGGIIFLNTGEQAGKLGIFVFEDVMNLKKEGNNNFVSSVKDQKLGSNYTILQGMLEDSNINPILENMDLLTTIRDAEEISNISKNIDAYLKNLSTLLKQ